MDRNVAKYKQAGGPRKDRPSRAPVRGDVAATITLLNTPVPAAARMDDATREIARLLGRQIARDHFHARQVSDFDTAIGEDSTR